MYGIFIFVTVIIKTVNSHGGHGDTLQTKNAIQDALLSYLCHGANGYPCNGHGSCSGGACTCYHGYSGLKCEINDADLTSIGNIGDTFLGGPDTGGGLTLDDLLSPLAITESPQVLACLSTDADACSGHGFCHQGNCICEPGHSGILCELSHEQGFCKTYKECAECTAFMNDCPKKCSLIAKFRLVFGFPRATDGDNFRKCRFRNSDFNCTFYFKQESESPQGLKTIAVKACLNYNEAITKANETAAEQMKDKPLKPVTPSPTPALTTTSTVDDRSSIDHSHEPHDTHTHDDHAHDTMADSGKQDTSKGGSGASVIKPGLFVIIGSVLMFL